ncbi:hypothetical protein GCM10010972_10690 [Cellulomonas carbonis]|uniref:Integral membrane protein n=2 Tax=Cellulomonas carbonis TaxID=1386092 RepID=A0A0A0BQZ8_9CELL|nr:hypothetical protein N868_15480 [Cellulomonas carbonis T26]GGB99794.1 hypothetical protein GCM10010972_10690 [Cellulomonas carbonis]
MARSVVLATAVAVAAVAAIWVVAVPMEAACVAIYPPPQGCAAADREAAGVAWTAVVAVAYALVLAVTVGLGRRWAWVTKAALGVLVVVAVLAFGAVQGSTGFIA